MDSKGKSTSTQISIHEFEENLLEVTGSKYPVFTTQNLSQNSCTGKGWHEIIALKHNLSAKSGTSTTRLFLDISKKTQGRSREKLKQIC